MHRSSISIEIHRSRRKKENSALREPEIWKFQEWRGKLYGWKMKKEKARRIVCGTIGSRIICTRVPRCRPCDFPFAKIVQKKETARHPLGTDSRWIQTNYLGYQRGERYDRGSYNLSVLAKLNLIFRERAKFANSHLSLYTLSTHAKNHPSRSSIFARRELRSNKRVVMKIPGLKILRCTFPGIRKNPWIGEKSP